jgi:hypothetical protein
VTGGISQDAGGVQQDALSHGSMLAYYSETLVSANRTQYDNPEEAVLTVTAVITSEFMTVTITKKKMNTICVFFVIGQKT